MEVKSFEERLRYERIEKEEMNRCLQQLMKENQQLRDQTVQVLAVNKKKEEREELNARRPQTVDVILKLLQGTQDFQKKMVKSSHRDDPGGEGEATPEVVQRGVELPKLPEWPPETGPIDFSDWLLVICPVMGGLSPSSEAPGAWYPSHMNKTPLGRLQHHPSLPPSLSQKKWARLERRASSLLLAPIPDSLREQVTILIKGMSQYQPGGLAEKSAPDRPRKSTRSSVHRQWCRHFEEHG